jgi:hypothetical protein
LFEWCPLILLVISWVTAQFYYLNPWSTFWGVLQSARRIMALTMVMGLALLVYALAEEELTCPAISDPS